MARNTGIFIFVLPLVFNNEVLGDWGVIYGIDIFRLLLQEKRRAVFAATSKNPARYPPTIQPYSICHGLPSLRKSAPRQLSAHGMSNDFFNRMPLSGCLLTISLPPAPVKGLIQLFAFLPFSHPTRPLQRITGH